MINKRNSSYWVVHSCRVAIIHSVKNVHFIVSSCQWQLSIIRDLLSCVVTGSIIDTCKLTCCPSKGTSLLENILNFFVWHED